MSNVTANKSATGGAVFTAPAGTTLPTDATTALADAFKSLGLIHEDGIKDNTNIETGSVKDMNGNEIWSDQTGFSKTFVYKLMEALNEEVIKENYGSENVTGTLATGLTIVETSTPLPEKIYVIDLVKGNGVKERIVIPRGKVVQRGERTYKASDPEGFDMTLSCTYDSTIAGYTKRYIKAATTSGSGQTP